jgi:ribosome maturation factor RimP
VKGIKFWFFGILGVSLLSDKDTNRRERSSFPSLFTMSAENAIDFIEKLVQPMLVNDMFLVNIRVKPTNNYKIFIDADSGLDIDKCIKVNRALYKIIEECGYHPDGDFSLEVSSPGIDEPLKLVRQYKKNIGRVVEITLNDGATHEGKLLTATEEMICIETIEGKGKKAVVKELTFNYEEIKETVVQIKF